MKKRILFLCQYFYPENVSSALLPFDTAKALAKAGNSVSVMCGYPNEYYDIGDYHLKQNEVVDSVNIHRIKYKSYKKSSRIGRVCNFFSFTAKCLRNVKYFKQI